MVLTSYIYGGLVLVSLALTWINNELVMTPEVYRSILGERLTASALDEQLNAMTRFRVWGYVAVPVVVWFRIAFVALVVQLFCLLGMLDIPIRSLFRASAIAFVAPLVGSLNRLVWIARLDAVDASGLAIAPDSLAAFILDPSQGGSWTYTLFSQMSVSQVAWVGLMILGLMGTRRLGVAGATLVTVGVWVLFALLRVALAVYLEHFGA